jgi:hypothetical protein
MCISLPVLAQSIKGSGNIVKESRSVSGFSGIEAGGVFHVYLRQGSQYALEIETDDNVISHISTKVQGNTLVLSMEKKVQKVHDLNVFLTLPELTHLNLSGASELEGVSTFSANHLKLNLSGAAELELNLEANQLIADLSGAAEVELTGTSEQVRLRMSGSASLDAESLIGKTGVVEMSGSTDAVIHLSEAMNAEVSGASDLICHGDPTQKTVEKSGSSTVVMR